MYYFKNDKYNSTCMQYYVKKIGTLAELYRTARLFRRGYLLLDSYVDQAPDFGIINSAAVQQCRG